MQALTRERHRIPRVSHLRGRKCQSNTSINWWPAVGGGGISVRSTRAGIDYSFKRKSAKPVIKSNACRAGLTVAYRCGWLLHEKEQQSGPSRYELFYRASYRLRPKIRPRALSISTRSNVPARSANRLFLNFPRAKIDTSVKRASAVNKQRTKFLSRRIARRV